MKFQLPIPKIREVRAFSTKVGFFRFSVTNPGFEQKMRKITIFETKYDHRGVSRNYRMDKNSPEMNDSEVELIAQKNPDEKYYFFVEKS